MKNHEIKDSLISLCEVLIDQIYQQFKKQVRIQYDSLKLEFLPMTYNVCFSKSSSAFDFFDCGYRLEGTMYEQVLKLPKISLIQQKKFYPIGEYEKIFYKQSKSNAFHYMLQSVINCCADVFLHGSKLQIDALIMPKMTASLSDVVKTLDQVKYHQLPIEHHLDNMIRISGQIAQGITGINKKGHYHGDIKPANIAIDLNGNQVNEIMFIDHEHGYHHDIDEQYQGYYDAYQERSPRFTPPYAAMRRTFLYAKEGYYWNCSIDDMIAAFRTINDLFIDSSLTQQSRKCSEQQTMVSGLFGQYDECSAQVALALEHKGQLGEMFKSLIGHMRSLFYAYEQQSIKMQIDTSLLSHQIAAGYLRCLGQFEQYPYRRISASVLEKIKIKMQYWKQQFENSPIYIQQSSCQMASREVDTPDTIKHAYSPIASLSPSSDVHLSTQSSQDSHSPIASAIDIKPLQFAQSWPPRSGTQVDVDDTQVIPIARRPSSNI